MKNLCSQLFVCKKYWLVILLCLQVLAGVAQPPPCPTLTPGKAFVDATTARCGQILKFSMSGTDIDPVIMYFLEVADSPSGPFNIPVAPITNPSEGFEVTATPGTWYYRIREFCQYGQNEHTDTLTVTVTGMSGFYTINSLQPASANNFTSFSSAVEALSCGGVSGPVVFNVTSNEATYHEQVIIPEIQGTSAVNTITFNGNGNTLAWGSTDYEKPAVLKLDGADYIIVDSLKIDATGGTYGFGVHLMNDADFNVFRRCVINADIFTNNSAFAGIVVNSNITYATGEGSALCDGNLFEHNTISGGYYGVVLAGGNNELLNNNSILNNDIRDTYFYSIYIAYTNSTIIQGNKISRPQRLALSGGTNMAFCGIYFTSKSTNAKVADNRLFDLTATDNANTGTIYGIYFYFCTATVAAPNIVYNNLLYNFNGSGDIYALVDEASGYAYYYHNTVSLDNTANSSNKLARGFYKTGTADGVAFVNNIISITRGGGGANYCIYINTSASVYTSDHNDFYMAAAATNNIGYSGSARKALTDWQTATSKDLASFSENPLFLRASEGNFIPNNATIDNKGTFVGVAQDIRLANRDLGLPDLGAYEYSPLACANPPAAATVVVAENPVCAAGTVALSLRAGDLGSGLTYQWQSSSDNNFWVNIGGGTGNKVAVAQTTDTWYRVVSTCGTSNSESAGTLVHTLLPISGIYTIDKNAATGGTNFKSFNDAWNAIKCGINGPIVFNVTPASGPYNEQLIMGPVPGASDVNTITFNGNENSITYTAGNPSQRAVIKLAGAKHIIIDNLVIQATGTLGSQYGYALHLMNSADSNVIRHCKIYTDTTLTSFNYAGIVVNGSASDATAGPSGCNYNVFEDNTVTGGFFGIALAAIDTGNIIRRNNIVNFYQYGIYKASSNLTLIDSNLISRPTRATVSTFNGIYVTGVQYDLTITRNRIFNPFGGNPDATDDFYGINFSSADGFASHENRITNNLIYNITGKGVVYGLANTGSDRAWYYHNTVNLDGATDNANYGTYGFYQTINAGAIRFNNNIISISRGGDGPKYAMYLSNTASIVNSDYNDLYIAADLNNKNIGFKDANRRTFAAWKLAGFDANSTSIDPVYADVDNANLEPTSAIVNNKGTALAALVPIDINSKTRDAVNPDLGAYEFQPPVCTSPPVAGVAIASDTVVCESTSIELSLTGNSVGSAQTYQWQVATSATGSFAPLSAVLNSPIYVIEPTETRYYRMAVSCGGLSSYTDPVKIEVNAALPAGTYIIDTNGTGHFLNFTQAKAAMGCGIKGPVVFNVLAGSGPYNEQLVLDSIPGTSVVNTVVFNGNGNTIHYSSDNSDERAVITLNSADYITFNDLKINAEGDGSYGWGVFVTNNADNNTFRNCRIELPLSSSSGNYTGVVIGASASNATGSGDAYCDYNLFQNDTIIGGYNGMTMMGSTNYPATGNKFIGNVVRDALYQAIYVGSTTNALIEGNDLSRPTRTAVSGFTGITSNGLSNNLVISKNKIHNTSDANTASLGSGSGISISSNSAPDDRPTIIANNLVYNLNGAGTVYGCQNSACNNVRLYHNTFSLDNVNNTSTSVATGYYQTSSPRGIEIKNNIITISRGGTGNKLGFNFTSTIALFASDNNDIWITGSGGKYVGLLGTGTNSQFASLSAWTTRTLTDAHSFSVDPLYTDIAANNFKPLLSQIDNGGTPVGITTDIYNVGRSALRPDIGAIEFILTPCITPPTPGIAAVTPSSGICMGTKVQLSLSGNSEGGTQKYLWQRAASAGGPWTNISDSSDISGFTYELVTSDSYFRAVVVCGTGVAYSAPAVVTLNPAFMAGDYTIDPQQPAGSTNFQSFKDAVAAMHCGIGGSVRFLAVPGTYTERVLIPKIPGASAAATITFLSRDNNASSVILTTDCKKDSNYVLKLDSTNYVSFKNMTITATGTDYARAVEITGTSSGDSISGCIIHVPVTTSSSPDITGIYGVELWGSDNVIVHNTIENGSAGVYLSGVAYQAQRFVIDSNTVSGNYFYNVYASNINRLSISGNTIVKEGLQNASSFGIRVENCDTVYAINRNSIKVTNTDVRVYGIYIISSEGDTLNHSSVSGNTIIANTGNTGTLYGVFMASARNCNYMNNVINIRSVGGDTTYGIYHFNTAGINCFNNSVQNASSTPVSIAGYFLPAAVASDTRSFARDKINISNNILSNTGGGYAMNVIRPEFTNSDYNLFYTSGPSLFLYSGSSYNLEQWRNSLYSDYNSMVYKPAFSDEALRPDVANPDVWAIHGRGVQKAGNDADINGHTRPVTLAAGVPDLGAYEFLPSAIPVSLTAIPATPVPNSTQIFMLGSDTVTKVTWGKVVPATVEGKRYSGVAPEGLAAGQPYMYFYTAFTSTGAVPAGHTVQQFYVNSWQGLIEKEESIRLGKTNASATWGTGAGSTGNIISNVLTDTGLTVLNKFTGLSSSISVVPPSVTLEAADTSNSGKKFWVAYGHHQSFGRDNTQQMVLFLGTGKQAARVTVHVNGTEWTKTYTIPANTAITSDVLPKYGPADARMMQEGLSDRGISIESDVAVTAYANIYGPGTSATTMLMPVGTYGYEYYALGYRQDYQSDSYAWFYVIAAYDSTVVEITPSQLTTGGHQADVPFTVNLKKGEVYQVMGAIYNQESGYDLTGSRVRSMSNANGKCYPVAVFSGSSNTAVNCQDNKEGSGDNLIQQNLSYRAWGKKYLTAPTSAATTPSILNPNVFKVMVKDPATVVTRNGVPLGGLINNRYYQFESAAGDYIEADKPVMMAQYIPSSAYNLCGYIGVGDPEMIYLTPVEAGIKGTVFYRTTKNAATVQYLTLVLPDAGVNSLTIDGVKGFDYSYPHPAIAGYTVAIKRWNAGNGLVSVTCDSTFTAITYGLGSFESYGYNIGMQVNGESIRSGIDNISDTAVGINQYTCAGSPFKLRFLSALQPSKIEWRLNGVGRMKPNDNVSVDNPVAVNTVVINGVTYYEYTLDKNYTIDTAGDYKVSVEITSGEIEACGSKLETQIPVKVIASPVVDFVVAGNCAAGTVQFAGTATTANNIDIARWSWDFDEAGAGSAAKDSVHLYSKTGTYQVKLAVTDKNGCIADTVKPVTVGAGPVVTMVKDPVIVCPGTAGTLEVASPVTGAVYNWYDAAAGGTAAHTGNSWTISNITTAASYWVESNLNGCTSAARKQVSVQIATPLTAPIAKVDATGRSTVTFSWTAVTGATAYEVTTNSGATWVTPSSGATGLTHTVTGLGLGEAVTLKVRVLGGCSPVESAVVDTTTVTEEVFIPNAFSPNNNGLAENESFRVYGNAIQQVHLMIFNQWGEKVFESRSKEQGWDGRYKGKPQPSGVYIYVVEVVLNNNKRETKKGAVNLIR